MSKTAKQSGEAGGPASGPSFEDALRKLESILESMESDDLSLEMLMAKYEEGIRLSQVCQARLTEAELRIQQLEKKAGGFVLKPAELPEE